MDQESTIRAKKRFLDKFELSRGNISLAVKAANVSRSAYYVWIQDDPDFKEQAYDIIEAGGDWVESKLMQRIDNDDTTAIIYYTKTKLKDRGYIERAETVNTNKTQAVVYIEKDEKDAINGHIDSVINGE